MQKKKLNQNPNRLPDQWICMVYDWGRGGRDRISKKADISIFFVCSADLFSTSFCLWCLFILRRKFAP